MVQCFNLHLPKHIVVDVGDRHKMIILYTGKRGAGKTLSMVKDAYMYWLDGWPVYTNMKNIAFPHTYVEEEDLLKIDKRTELDDCVLVIDEIQILLESRTSGRVSQRNFSYFIQQIRKRNIILLCTTQFTNTVDLRLRQHLDVKAEPYFDKALQVCEVKYIDLTQLFNGSVFGDIMLEDNEEDAVASVVYDAIQVYGLYDTKEKI